MPSEFADIPSRVISPDRLDPKIGLDLMTQPKWKISDKVVIEAAVVGGVVKRVRNPNQTYSLDEIRKAAIECVEAGATAVHIHPLLLMERMSVKRTTL